MPPLLRTLLDKTLLNWKRCSGAHNDHQQFAMGLVLILVRVPCVRACACVRVGGVRAARAELLKKRRRTSAPSFRRSDAHAYSSGVVQDVLCQHCDGSEERPDEVRPRDQRDDQHCL